MIKKKKIKKIIREIIKNNKDPIISYSALIGVILLIISPFAFGGASVALASGVNHVLCLIVLGISFLGTAAICVLGIYLLYYRFYNRLLMKAKEKGIKRPAKKIKAFLFLPILCEAIFLMVLLESAVGLCVKGVYEAAGFFFFLFFVLSFTFSFIGIMKEFE